MSNLLPRFVLVGGPFKHIHIAVATRVPVVGFATEDVIWIRVSSLGIIKRHQARGRNKLIARLCLVRIIISNPIELNLIRGSRIRDAN